MPIEGWVYFVSPQNTVSQKTMLKNLPNNESDLRELFLFIRQKTAQAKRLECDTQ